MKEKFVHFFSEISNLNVYLYTFCVCLGAVVLLSQVGLLINPIRNTLTVVDVLDGKTSGNTDTKCGFVTLTLTNGTPSENILIYLNGIESDVFDADVKTIELYENTVIEIYSKEIIKINISGYSDNLESVMNNNNNDIKGINVLGRFVFTN